MLIKKQQTSKNKQKNEKLTCILPKTRNKASFTLKSWQYCQKFNVKLVGFNKKRDLCTTPKMPIVAKTKNGVTISLTSPLLLQIIHTCIIN